MWDDAGARWSAFRSSLQWQPIAYYDRSAGHVVLLRAGEEEAIGYRKDNAWRHAQESLDDRNLSFEPTEFAEVDDEWRIHFMAD